MARPKKSALAELKSKARFAGIDADALIAELVNEIVGRLPPQPDEAALALRVTEQVEASMGSRLQSFLDNLTAKEGASPSLDTQAVVSGVVAVLEPKLGQAAMKAAEQVWQVNSVALKEQVAGLISLAQPPQDGAGSLSERSGGVDMRSLLAYAIDNADGIAKLAAIMRPQHTTEQRLAEQLMTAFRLHTIFGKLEKGQLGAEELERSLLGLTTKAAQG